MYLRGLRYRSSILTSQARVGSVARPKVLQFSDTSRRLAEEQINARGEKSDSKHGKSNDGDRREPKGGSVRPLTVFAICIPLGYTLNWALKQRDEAALSDADGFVKYKLAHKEDISPTCSIFTLKPTTPSAIRTDDPAVKRVITSVQFKQPQLQIARNYTLLPPKEGQDPQELSLLIRKELNGEVSGYLHRLAVGSEIELRGLSAEYVLPENVDTVLFLAGGTGIAPAMQVADALAGKAPVHILWASRRREDCVGGTSDTIKELGQNRNLSGWRIPLDYPSSRNAKKDVTMKTSQDKNAIVSQLERLKERSTSGHSETTPSIPKLLVDYHVDEEDNFIQSKDVQWLLQLTGSKPLENNDAPKKLLFVAGPEGFVNYWAAPKQWIGGREVQGPLGGVLSSLNLHGWEVVKL